MNYSIEDLVMFKPLSSPEEREDTSYFELHPKELPRPYACWIPGSFFIPDAAFDFFVDCFHSASDGFDYYTFQRFDEYEVRRLLEALNQYLDAIASDTSPEIVFSRHASVFGAGVWSDVDISFLRKAVHECGKKMIEFIQLNTKESKCLWVLGM